MTNKDNNKDLPKTTSEFLLKSYKLILVRKKYWLIPVWFLLVLIAIIIFLSGSGALLPAIYMAI